MKTAMKGTEQKRLNKRELQAKKALDLYELLHYETAKEDLYPDLVEGPIFIDHEFYYVAAS